MDGFSGLPHEIIQYWISLVDDPVSLCACAQLSRQWLEWIDEDDKLRWATRAEPTTPDSRQQLDSFHHKKLLSSPHSNKITYLINTRCTWISAGVHRRLEKELATYDAEAPYFWGTVCPTNRLSTWEAKLTGPEDTPYEGGTFLLSISFPSQYPFKAPLVEFLTPIYHPQVYKTKLCADILSHSWSPAYTIMNTLLAIRNILREPDTTNPLEHSIGKHFQENPLEANKMAKEWTEKYAKGSTEDKI